MEQIKFRNNVNDMGHHTGVSPETSFLLLRSARGLFAVSAPIISSLNFLNNANKQNKYSQKSVS